MGYRNFRIVGGETMDLKFNEYGELILPPQKPVLDKSGWVRMTRQRWAKIKAHEEAMEKWTVEKAKYDAIPPCTQTGMEAKIEFYRSRGKLLRNHGGIVLFDVDCIDHETEERIAETHAFFDELRRKAEEAKRKEGVQTTLDGVVRFVPPVRVVSTALVKSFGKKPNHYLEKAWLESIWYNVPLTDWQSFQISKREKEFVGGW